MARLVGQEHFDGSDICPRWRAGDVEGVFRKGMAEDPSNEERFVLHKYDNASEEETNKDQSGKEDDEEQDDEEEDDEEEEFEEVEAENGAEDDDSDLEEEEYIELDVDSSDSDAAYSHKNDQAPAEGERDDDDPTTPQEEAQGDQGVKQDANRHRPVLKRVLIRMVFAHKGRSAMKAESCLELLEAAKVWVQTLYALDAAGIVHRDVSIGNLMLHDSSADISPGASGADQVPAESAGDRPLAFIIDLGLASWSPPSDDGSVVNPQDDMQTHGHLTGTLPFIALEPLLYAHPGSTRRKSNQRKAQERKAKKGKERQGKGNQEVQQGFRHQVHHDIESVFWVLVYIALIEGNNEDDEEKLQSYNPNTVYAWKLDLLQNRLHDPSYPKHLTFRGRFKQLGPFLRKFAKILFQRFRMNRPYTSEKVIGLIDEAVAGLRTKIAKVPVQPEVTLRPSPGEGPEGSSGSKRRLEVNLKEGGAGPVRKKIRIIRKLHSAGL
ncbi:hypothetical protein FRB90_008207 [Tulasnella sp. 427]|nr:hypothetical protein FRB90_008207 [Tulasnella sp. 427]